jgi:glyoxylase-like metal-dependent hydrolase (beta-lactamase superfamily II)
LEVSGVTELENREVGPLTVLFGKDNGKYPHGNSLYVKGSESSVIIDPCLGVVERKDHLPAVDMVLHSHTHEDHVAGSHLFPDVPWYCHPDDRIGLESIDGMMTMYGLPPGEAYDGFREEILTSFCYAPASDLHTFDDGEAFDLGGVVIRVIHTPGHTRGHCCFEIAWGETAQEKLVYLGDIELTGFGPYYGDAWSDLEDFERSMEKLRTVDAEWWLTFHHKGLIESRDKFLSMLDQFEAMIPDREERLLAFLTEPRSMPEIVEHRFIYRPGQGGFMVESIEERSMQMHLQRLIRAGRVSMQEDRYMAASPVG